MSDGLVIGLAIGGTLVVGGVVYYFASRNTGGTPGVPGVGGATGGNAQNIGNYTVRIAYINSRAAEWGPTIGTTAIWHSVNDVFSKVPTMTGPPIPGSAAKEASLLSQLNQLTTTVKAIGQGAYNVDNSGGPFSFLTSAVSSIGNIADDAGNIASVIQPFVGGDSGGGS